MYNLEQFKELLDKTKTKNYKVMAEFAVALITKLNEKQIEDEELAGMFDTLLESYTQLSEGENTQKRVLSRIYAKIQEHVKKQHNLEQKGTIQGTYMAIFIGVGVALGVALSSANMAFMGAGIAIGAGLGVAIGTSMEKKAEDEGRLY